MKITITKCSDGLSWYNRQIGSTFEVTRMTDAYWVRTGDAFNTLNYILFDDATLQTEDCTNPPQSLHKIS